MREIQKNAGPAGHSPHVDPPCGCGSMDLRPFKKLIKESAGLSFEHNRTVSLAKAIRCRIDLHALKSDGEYLRVLSRNRSELTSLINLLTINETYFFRESAHLKLLCERLAPELLARKAPGARLRILSAGCSTGEEPYSIAMALTEAVGSQVNDRVRIFGIDVDSSVIARAKRARYGKQSFRGFDPLLKARYFRDAGQDLFQLNGSLRDLVEFHDLSLSNDRYPEGFAGMDVIFYRNVSIYFEPETRRRIFCNLSRLLNEGGYLILSSTETLSHKVHENSRLSLVELDGVFLYRRCAHGARKTVAPPASGPIKRSTQVRNERVSTPCMAQGPWTPAGLPCVDPLLVSSSRPAPVAERGGRQEAPPPVSPGASADEALAHARRKEYGPALDIAERLIEKDRSHVSARTIKASVLMNLDRVDDAEEACLEAAALDPLCLEAYLLLGLIARRKGDEEGSIARLKQALYIRSSCWLAHYHLAEAYRSLKDTEKARREYGIVLSLIEKDGLSDPGLSLFSLSIPVDDLIHLCRHNASRLDPI